MSQMRTKLWRKFGFGLSSEGRHGREANVNSLMGKSNVNEEYQKTFRTKSYIDMCNKVQGQLEIRTSLDREKSSPSSSPSSTSSLSRSSSPHTRHVHLSDYLLDPGQDETLIRKSNLHQYLANYYKISLEACHICENLLMSVQQTRVNYRSIMYVIKLIKQVPDSVNWTHNQHNSAYRNLASFASHRNPFSSMTAEKFRDLHEIHIHLLQELTSNCRKTKRRTKFIKCIKRVLSAFLVVGCGALAIALIILALHSMVGIIPAAPIMLFCSLGLLTMRKRNRPEKRLGKDWDVEGLDEQLDIAARGVYILINDFDTISRVVQRLIDEMEHMKFVADICVRKGKVEMLKEVVKEFQMHESCFLEQLEELEKQIYLCFLDINRSRRLVLQEMAKY